MASTAGVSTNGARGRPGPSAGHTRRRPPPCASGGPLSLRSLSDPDARDERHRPGEQNEVAAVVAGMQRGGEDDRGDATERREQDHETDPAVGDASRRVPA